MFWCSLVGADRPPKQAMPVARQEGCSLCRYSPFHAVKNGIVCLEVEELMFWLSLSLQSFPRCKKWHCMFRSGRVDVLVFFGRSGLPA